MASVAPRAHDTYMISRIDTTNPNGTPASIAVHIPAGASLPGFDIVGIPLGQVRNVRDRLRAAAINGGHPWPLRRVTVQVTGTLWSGMDAAIMGAVLACARGEHCPVDAITGGVTLAGGWIPVPAPSGPNDL